MPIDTVKRSFLSAPAARSAWRTGGAALPCAKCAVGQPPRPTAAPRSAALPSGRDASHRTGCPPRSRAADGPRRCVSCAGSPWGRHFGRGRIDLDEHHRELAVLACRQVEFAAQTAPRSGPRACSPEGLVAHGSGRQARGVVARWPAAAARAAAARWSAGPPCAAPGAGRSPHTAEPTRGPPEAPGTTQRSTEKLVALALPFEGVIAAQRQCPATARSSRRRGNMVPRVPSKSSASVAPMDRGRVPGRRKPPGAGRPRRSGRFSASFTASMSPRCDSTRGHRSARAEVSPGAMVEGASWLTRRVLSCCCRAVPCGPSRCWTSGPRRSRSFCARTTVSMQWGPPTAARSPLDAAARCEPCKTCTAPGRATSPGARRRFGQSHDRCGDGATAAPPPGPTLAAASSGLLAVAWFSGLESRSLLATCVSIQRPSADPQVLPARSPGITEAGAQAATHGPDTERYLLDLTLHDHHPRQRERAVRRRPATFSSAPSRKSAC